MHCYSSLYIATQECLVLYIGTKVRGCLFALVLHVSNLIDFNRVTSDLHQCQQDQNQGHRPCAQKVCNLNWSWQAAGEEGYNRPEKWEGRKMQNRAMGLLILCLLTAQESLHYPSFTNLPPKHSQRQIPPFPCHVNLHKHIREKYLEYPDYEHMKIPDRTGRAGLGPLSVLEWTLARHSREIKDKVAGVCFIKRLQILF